MRRQAKVTSKGQVTVPQEIRKMLGIGAGDGLVFETGKSGVRVRPVRVRSRFAKYRGIGNPGMISGRRGIARWLRMARRQ